MVRGVSYLVFYSGSDQQNCSSVAVPKPPLFFGPVKSSLISTDGVRASVSRSSDKLPQPRSRFHLEFNFFSVE